MPRLRSFALDSPSHPDYNLVRALQSRPRLEHLNLKFGDPRGEELVDIRGFKNLKTIHMYGFVRQHLVQQVRKISDASPELEHLFVGYHVNPNDWRRSRYSYESSGSDSEDEYESPKPPVLETIWAESLDPKQEVYDPRDRPPKQADHWFEDDATTKLVQRPHLKSFSVANAMRNWHYFGPIWKRVFTETSIANLTCLALYDVLQDPEGITRHWEVEIYMDQFTVEDMQADTGPFHSHDHGGGNKRWESMSISGFPKPATNDKLVEFLIEEVQSGRLRLRQLRIRTYEWRSTLPLLEEIDTLELFHLEVHPQFGLDYSQLIPAIKKNENLKELRLETRAPIGTTQRKEYRRMPPEKMNGNDLKLMLKSFPQLEHLCLLVHWTDVEWSRFCILLPPLLPNLSAIRIRSNHDSAIRPIDGNNESLCDPPCGKNPFAEHRALELINAFSEMALREDKEYKLRWVVVRKCWFRTERRLIQASLHADGEEQEIKDTVDTAAVNKRKNSIEGNAAAKTRSHMPILWGSLSPPHTNNSKSKPNPKQPTPAQTKQQKAAEMDTLMKLRGWETLAWQLDREDGERHARVWEWMW